MTETETFGEGQPTMSPHDAVREMLRRRSLERTACGLGDIELASLRQRDSEAKSLDPLNPNARELATQTSMRVHLAQSVSVFRSRRSSCLEPSGRV